MEPNSHAVKLTYLKTMEIMARRQRPFEYPSSYEVDNMVVSVTAQVDAGNEKEAETEFRRSLYNKKSPIHSNLQVNEKDGNSSRFFSANANSLLFWLNHNYKAEQLKYILVKYQVKKIGLQETCLNWSKSRPSKTLTSLLHNDATPIQSVHSYNVVKDENIGLK